METSSLANASLPGGGDLEEEFIAELIDNFYNSLRRWLSLVLKGARTLFGTLKSILVMLLRGLRLLVNFKTSNI